MTIEGIDVDLKDDEPDSPLPPFFEFNSADESDLFVFDKPGHINQEPPELQEYGPDKVFDSRGRLAELGVEDFVVVIKGWSKPNIDLFGTYLRTAAARYLPRDVISVLSTVEVRDHMHGVLRQRQREHSLFGRLSMFARSLWRPVPRQ
jgi:hypothetical protein